MAQQGIEAIIRPNLHHLSDKLTNIPGVLNHLMSKRVLGADERDQIWAYPTDYQRSTQLFRTLERKDIDKDTLLLILSVSGNNHLVEILESTYQELNGIGNSSSDRQMDWDVPPLQGTNLSNPTPHGTTSADVTSPNFSRRDLLEEYLSRVPHPNSKTILNFVDDINLIGQGSYGKVFKVELSGKFFAVKISKDLECRREKMHLADVDHPNIISYIDSWDERVSDDIKRNKKLRDWFKTYDTLYCIVTEWCDGGDLYDWLTLPKSQKSENDAKRICYQIARGIEYLHNKEPNPLLHRDLKPDNIFLLYEYKKNDSVLQVKIGDLGLCRSTIQPSRGSRANLMTIKVGNKEYMAPEVRGKNDNYTIAIDIFAMGLIFYELIMSTTDYDPEYDDQTNKITSTWFINTFKNEHQFFSKMFSVDANNRPKASDICTFLSKEWNI